MQRHVLHHVWGKFAFNENGRLCCLSKSEMELLRERSFGRLIQNGLDFEKEVRAYIINHYGDGDEGSVLTENILLCHTAKVLERSIGKLKEEVLIAFISECEAERQILFKGMEARNYAT